MRRATKAERKMLASMAKQLPPTAYRANQNRLVTPSELLKQRGEVIPDGTLAQLTKSIMVPINHEKRIIKAFESGGMDSAREYINGVLDLATKNSEQINVSIASKI